MAKIKHNHFIDSVDEMLATAVGLEAIVVGTRGCCAALRYARNDGGDVNWTEVQPYKTGRADGSYT